VEHGVGYGRRNFLVPIPAVSSFEELNAHLLAQCLADDARTVQGQTMTIGEAECFQSYVEMGVTLHLLGGQSVKPETVVRIAQG
jgi:hypothetical protein